ncbi:MAG TPA: TonB-dependent receptor [Candidatus Baltobacteraceae bacterium]|jgi:iron complex outermembrane receptor protein|nr:TonB-dependent receptor [Candidatus Baltobacteraceae bacterium]
MFLPLLLVATFAGSPGPLNIVDDRKRPIASAVVTFVDRDGNTDVERSSPSGDVRIRDGFLPIRIHIDAAGFQSVDLPFPGLLGPIRLDHALSTIAAVSVATGSARNLHTLPLAASVLDEKAIAASTASTTDSLLRSLPGFDLDRSNSEFTNYGQLRVSLNGAGEDRGLLLVDGIPAQDAFGGQVDWNAYPVGDVTRAEILRGPGSALYGSGAIGGVVALDTRGPAPFGAKQGTDGSVSGELGGNDRAGASAFVRSTLSPALAASLWSSRTQFSYNDLAPGYRSPIDVAAFSQNSADAFTARLGSPSSNVEFSNLLSHDAQTEGRPNYTFARALEQYALRYFHSSSFADTTISAYERDSYVTNVADQYPAKPGVLRYIQNVPSWENGIEAIVRATPANWELQARGELRAVHGISNQVGAGSALQSEGSGSQQLGGLALQASLHEHRFEGLVGARYDQTTFSNGTSVSVNSTTHLPITTLAPGRTDAAISPRAGLRYDLSPALALRLSAGDGIRSPYLNELVRGYVIGSTTYLPNINLIPERSKSFTFGLDDVDSRNHASLDFTHTDVANAIAFETTSPTTQMRSNIDQTQTDGITGTFQHKINECVNLDASATEQAARVASGPAAIIGKRLAYIPNSNASLGIDDSAGALRFGVDANYFGQTYADDLNTEPLGAALTFDAHAGTSFGDGSSLKLSWQNLTRQVYLSSIDRIAPPATLQLTFTQTFGRTRPKSVCSG